MVVPLDSPRWNELRHAYGPAGDTPALIRAVEEERVPNYRDGGAWFDVYSSLYHQSSTYSATYAALPYLVRIAEVGTLGQRVAVLCLVGEIRVRGRADEAIPSDLLPDFESALIRTRATSLATMREAARVGLADSEGASWTLGDLLFALGGLHHPRSGFVAQLDYLTREDWNTEPDCPVCGNTQVAELREQGVVTLQLDGRGWTSAETARAVPVDRSGYPGLLAKGQVLLEGGRVEWELGDMPLVLAALADEFGDRVLGARILDLATVVRCAYCGESFELSTGLHAL